MADDSSQQKTEQPTPYKLRKARERGEVAVSKDLSSALILAAAGLALARGGEQIVAQLQACLRTAFARVDSGPCPPDELLRLLGSLFLQANLVIAPILLAIVAIAVVVPFLQSGGVLSGQPLKPQLNRLNPLAGFKRMFFSLSPYVELLKGVLVVTVAGLLLWQAVRASLRDVALSGELPPGDVGRLIAYVVGAFAKKAILFFFVLAVLDTAYQRWQYSQNQRMTKEEVKREYKQQEGDPTHKAARRRLHEEIAMSTMLQQVRKADVVVANPDHVACALSYDPDEENAPRLLAKGQGYLAEKIKEIARAERIPIVQNISLAQALYQLELDDLIPEALYEAVAEVLRWVEATLREEGRIPPWVEEGRGT